jgi:thiol-disulfide isomerase/thioredoxin
MLDWTAAFSSALSYDDFLARHANDGQKERWKAAHDRVRLSPDQEALLSAFTRRMPVLCLSGAWCGDCVEQCPILDRIAAASPHAIDLRFLDRDTFPEIRDALSICGGHRVPTVVWFNEDMQEVQRFGDRVLSKYRQVAADRLGSSCPTGLVLPDEPLLTKMTAEWVDLFERVHLLLRLSPRLRERHGD